MPHVMRHLLQAALVLAAGTACHLPADSQQIAGTAAANADPSLTAEHWVFPDDARVVNVRDFGAVGDGEADDTVALRDAVAHVLGNSPRYGAPRFLYLPDGTYRVTGPIESRVHARLADGDQWNGWRAGLNLIGESRGGTVIRLADAAGGYGDPEQPQAVLRTGSEAENTDQNRVGGGNRAFRHYVRNLTIDIGAGNPGAIALDYMVSNRGAVSHVTLRSSDPSGAGHTGLSMNRGWPGPCLIKNVLIDGFDVGVSARHYQYGVTFENLTLRGQNRLGIDNSHNALWFLNLRSENTVPAIQSRQDASLIVLVNSNLTGGADDAAAIRYQGTLLARDTVVAGYGVAVDDMTTDEPAADRDIGGDLATGDLDEGRIDLYATDILAEDGAEPLELPIRPTPTYQPPPPDQWASVTDFGATVTTDWGDEDRASRADDDAPGIQAAIDSGAEVVYLPNGIYFVSEPIILRGNVRLMLGMAAMISPPEGTGVQPLIRFDGGPAEGTIIEHVRIRNSTLEHNADRSLTLRHSGMGRGYRNTENATGDLYIEDVIGHLRMDHPQDVWMRQINAEFGPRPMIVNTGGRVWIFGYKTETKTPVVVTRDGGQTEVLGGLFYRERRWSGPNDQPMFLVEGEGSRLTASFVRNGSSPYPLHLLHRKPDGTTLELDWESTPRGRGPALLIAE